MKKVLRFLLLAVVSTSLYATPSKTLDNLQTAFNGESNAQARYIAFSKQADKEGFPSIATLFRAAAQAEEIHANNHAKVIRKLGAEPKAQTDKFAVKSTRENLQASIAGESYERDKMYPEFVKDARAEKNADAVETFNLAKAAEAEHAKLYAASEQKLDKLKGVVEKYYVCTVCGFTTTKVDFEKCPSCFKPKESYVAVA